MNSQQWKAGKSNEEVLLEACAVVQVELNEVDGNAVLDMPAFQFDMVCEVIRKRYKALKGTEKKEKEVKGVFGG